MLPILASFQNHAHFFHGQKASKVSIPDLEDLVIFSLLCDDWVEKGHLSQDAVDQVDWQMVGQSMKSSQSMKSLPVGI